MRWFCLFLWIASGCGMQHASPDHPLFDAGGNIAAVESSPLLKQKQKLSSLEKKLDQAEKERREATEEVEKLQREIHQAHLALIQRQVEHYEKQLQKIQSEPEKYAHLLRIETSGLFLKERELLHHVIQNGTAPSASEAQLVLDRILRMITELGDGVVR